MTFAELEIDATIMRQTNPSYFTATEFSDAQLVALNKEQSKQEMLIDCYNILQIQNDSDKLTSLNYLIDGFEESFQNVLMLCQLKNHYNSLSRSTNNQELYKFWVSEYQKDLQTISNLKTSNFSAVSTGRISRG